VTGRPVRVAVCGPADATDAEMSAAREVGELLAQEAVDQVIRST